MSTSNKKDRHFHPFVVWVMSVLYRIYAWTWRKKIIYSPEFLEYLEKNEPILLSHWHEHINTLLYMAKVKKVVAMISDSKDGELVYQIIANFGSTAARGSARKNPIKALKGFIRLMKKDLYWAVIAVDGPRGPRRQVKPAITEMSKLFKCPIFTISVAASSVWTFNKSWDKGFVPKPFSKVVFYFGPGLDFNESCDPKDPELLNKLENAMSENHEKSISLI